MEQLHEKERHLNEEELYSSVTNFINRIKGEDYNIHISCTYDNRSIVRFSTLMTCGQVYECDSVVYSGDDFNDSVSYETMIKDKNKIVQKFRTLLGKETQIKSYLCESTDEGRYFGITISREFSAEEKEEETIYIKIKIVILGAFAINIIMIPLAISTLILSKYI